MRRRGKYFHPPLQLIDNRQEPVSVVRSVLGITAIGNANEPIDKSKSYPALKKENAPVGGISGTADPERSGRPALISQHSLGSKSQWASSRFIYFGSGTKSAASQSLEEFLGGDGKLGDAHSRSIIDSIGYCRSNDADAGFSDCFRRNGPGPTVDVTNEVTSGGTSRTQKIL